MQLLGFAVVEAVNGEDALLLTEASQFSAIVMDLSMPIMDGISATRIIREKLRLETPIIILTSLLQERHTWRHVDGSQNPFRLPSLVLEPVEDPESLDPLLDFAYQNGANKALVKPSSLSEIRRLLDSLGLLNDIGMAEDFSELTYRVVNVDHMSRPLSPSSTAGISEQLAELMLIKNKGIGESFEIDSMTRSRSMRSSFARSSFADMDLDTVALNVTGDGDYHATVEHSPEMKVVNNISELEQKLLTNQSQEELSKVIEEVSKLKTRRSRSSFADNIPELEENLLTNQSPEELSKVTEEVCKLETRRSRSSFADICCSEKEQYINVATTIH